MVTKPKDETTPGTDLALVDAVSSPFLAIRESAGNADLTNVMHDNLGEGGVTAFDLDRVKVPSGGGKAWEIPSLTDDVEIARTFDGIIVHWREPRAYWEKALDDSGGGTPPDCNSQDGKLGIGNPGGNCQTCQYAQFGTAMKGGVATPGQACKQMRLMFVLREDGLLPLALFAPPTSLKGMRKYFLRLASQGKRFSDVVTRFSLAQTDNQGGIEYSYIEPTLVRVLSPEECGVVRAYGQGMATAFDAVQITADDVVEPEADPS